MITAVDHHPQALHVFLAAMAQKYVPADCRAKSELAERIAARVMTVGTYRDVCELVDLAGRDYLLRVFTTSPGHWFSAPACEYWARHLEVSARGIAGTRATAALGPHVTARAHEMNTGARASKH